MDFTAPVSAWLRRIRYLADEQQRTLSADTSLPSASVAPPLVPTSQAGTTVPDSPLSACRNSDEAKSEVGASIANVSCPVALSPPKVNGITAVSDTTASRLLQRFQACDWSLHEHRRFLCQAFP